MSSGKWRTFCLGLNVLTLKAAHVISVWHSSKISPYATQTWDPLVSVANHACEALNYSTQVEPLTYIAMAHPVHFRVEQSPHPKI